MNDKTGFISWERLDADTQALAALVAPFGPFTGIVAVSRGGLVPAAILARLLNIRLIDTVCLTSYEDHRRGEVHLVKTPEIAGSGRGWLVIDDLVDSGATAQATRKLLPEAHLATVYAKPAGRPFADTVAVTVEQDVWLEFPWEGP